MVSVLLGESGALLNIETISVVELVETLNFLVGESHDVSGGLHLSVGTLELLKRDSVLAIFLEDLSEGLDPLIWDIETSLLGETLGLLEADRAISVSISKLVSLLAGLLGGGKESLDELLGLVAELEVFEIETLEWAAFSLLGSGNSLGFSKLLEACLELSLSDGTIAILVKLTDDSLPEFKWKIKTISLSTSLGLFSIERSASISVHLGKTFSNLILRDTFEGISDGLKWAVAILKWALGKLLFLASFASLASLASLKKLLNST